MENCIYQIAKHMPDSHRVTIISKWRKGLPRKMETGNITILRVTGSTKQAYLSHAIRRAKLAGSYDFIQIDNRPNFARSVRRAFPGIPISVFMHSMTFVSSPMTTWRAANSAFRYADLIVGNSRSLEETLATRFPAHRHKMKYVHLGVDISKFHPNSRRKEGPFHILFAGRLIPRKGIPVLLKAFRIARKEVPGLRLSIAGGSQKPAYGVHLRRIARELHVPVQFKGNLSRSQMPAFYRSGDCFVCPSQQHEAFGLVNVEAMACGLPVIASDIGGIPEIVEHGRNGYLVGEYHKPSRFAEYLIKMAQDDGLHKQLAVQARNDAKQRFAWSLTAKKLIKMYSMKNKEGR
ncbi:glycosyltransferase family 4 protein [Paenibacillus sp. CCS19]|uniref:glycosyltransferase family 4 protein n=1 Tax=Paenibacillus sp. CCS19 TaxID=3158387 RepID=UPI00295EF43D|nr:glycosyltransferase family 4 protein [Paenibacillus cellulosilyticus]